jgi:hypothetical protein
MEFFDDKDELWWEIPCSIIFIYAIYYFFNFSEKWDTNVVSVPTFLIEIVKIAVFVLCGLPGMVSTFLFLTVIISNIPAYFRALGDIPSKIRHELIVIKRIWNNRGFGKYNLFGGIRFYVKLRLRVLAFFFAFLFFGSSSFYLYKQYEVYEPTHWIEKVYHHSEPREFKFKKGVTYTVCLHGSKIEYIYVNGYYFCSTESAFNGKPDFYSLINFNPHNTFNITFPTETNFAILLHTEMVLNDITSKKYEIWENKKDGVEYPYTVFDPRTYTTDKNQEKQNNKETTKKKKSK